MRNKSIHFLLIFSMLFGLAFLPSVGSTAEAAETARTYRTRIECEGYFLGHPATLNGVETYEPYNELGDGPISYSGILTIYEYEYPVYFDDYVGLAPYDGYIQAGQYTYSIGVLYNSDGTTTIYDGRPTLKASDIWGEFNCSW